MTISVHPMGLILGGNHRPGAQTFRRKALPLNICLRTELHSSIQDLLKLLTRVNVSFSRTLMMEMRVKSKLSIYGRLGLQTPPQVANFAA